jgi:hypothetical protein
MAGYGAHLEARVMNYQNALHHTTYPPMMSLLSRAATKGGSSVRYDR